MMLYFFLSNDENVEEILNEKNDSNCKATYATQITNLKEHCIKTLGMKDIKQPYSQRSKLDWK